MLTKNIIEGSLYISNHREMMINILKDLKIPIEESEQHTELYFLDSFKFCAYLQIIDKQITTYFIGERYKGKKYNILKITGNTCSLQILSKNELINQIVEEQKLTEKEYLPLPFAQRIVFINPEYDKDKYKPFVFNRMTFDEKMFRKSDWSIGTNMYSLDNTYRLHGTTILKNMLNDIM